MIIKTPEDFYIDVNQIAAIRCENINAAAKWSEATGKRIQTV